MGSCILAVSKAEKCYSNVIYIRFHCWPSRNSKLGHGYATGPFDSSACSCCSFKMGPEFCYNNTGPLSFMAETCWNCKIYQNTAVSCHLIELTGLYFIDIIRSFTQAVGLRAFGSCRCSSSLLSISFFSIRCLCRSAFRASGDLKAERSERSKSRKTFLVWCSAKVMTFHDNASQVPWSNLWRGLYWLEVHVVAVGCRVGKIVKPCKSDEQGCMTELQFGALSRLAFIPS